jgi:hypothetical protein
LEAVSYFHQLKGKRKTFKYVIPSSKKTIQFGQKLANPIEAVDMYASFCKKQVETDAVHDERNCLFVSSFFLLFG